MTDPYAETDEWPLPRYSGDSKVPATFAPSTQITPVPAPESTHSPERVVSEGSDADDAQGALVERLARVVNRADNDYIDTIDRPECPWDTFVSRAVLPLVAAEVEAAVSVVRAGADETPVPENAWPNAGQLWHRLINATEADRLEGLDRLIDEAARTFGAERRAESAESDLRALREKVAKVEAQVAKAKALHREWVDSGGNTNRCRECGEVWPCATHRLLSDPTTPDEAGGA